MRIHFPAGRRLLLLGRLSLRGRIVLLAIAASAVAVPVAWASHDFSDVPTDHQFHTQISAIKNAGITTGCGPGAYCPTTNVTREAMAAFMHRGYGRVAYSATVVDDTIEPISNSVYTTIGQVQITVPGAGSGTQFVKVDAHVTAQFESGTPEFPYNVLIKENNCDISSGAWGGAMLGTIPASGWTYTPVSTSWVVGTPPGPHTFRLCGATSPGNVARVAALNIVATTFPFGSGGGSTLTTGASPRNRVR